MERMGRRGRRAGGGERGERREGERGREGGRGGEFRSRGAKAVGIQKIPEAFHTLTQLQGQAIPTHPCPFGASRPAHLRILQRTASNASDFRLLVLEGGRQAV